MPIWGAIIAFTGMFVIYFIVLHCISRRTKKLQKLDATQAENKAFDDVGEVGEGNLETDLKVGEVDETKLSDEKVDPEKILLAQQNRIKISG